MNLKQIRKQKQYTQEQVAKIINITQSQYAKKEKGISIITSDEIVKLCKAMNVSADYLLGLIEENK